MINNENKVYLIGHYGGDKRVCLSAWQSTAWELGIDISDIPQDARVDEIFKIIAKRKKKTPIELLQFLGEHKHGTPFEKTALDFQLDTDIASHIHCLKHRIASINGESARYKELEDKAYVPSDWYDCKTIDDRAKALGKNWGEVLENVTRINNTLYHLSLTETQEQLGRKRAKESARYFLMYNKQMSFDFMMNFRAFALFQQLRNSKHAQLEIRNIADDMLQLVKNIPSKPFEGCLSAFSLI